MKRKTPEGNVKSAVLQYLALKGMKTIRINSGSIIGSTGGRKWRVKLADEGTADILTFRRGACSCQGSLPVWIETKAPKKGQEAAQLAFQKEVEELGHVYMVVRDVKELIHWIDGIY